MDPAETRAQAVLASKAKTFTAPAYASTTIYPDIPTAVKLLKEQSVTPDLVILGSPPAFRGTTDSSSGKDAEVQLTTAFSKAALFVEKPVSTGTVDEAKKVGDVLESRKSNLVSVGYMLRYSAAVQKMKQIIQENNLEVMMTSARYVMGKSTDLRNNERPQADAGV